jgi:hypothetical protein
MNNSQEEKPPGPDFEALYDRWFKISAHEGASARRPSRPVDDLVEDAYDIGIFINWRLAGVGTQEARDVLRKAIETAGFTLEVGRELVELAMVVQYLQYHYDLLTYEPPQRKHWGHVITFRNAIIWTMNRRIRALRRVVTQLQEAEEESESG